MVRTSAIWLCWRGKVFGLAICQYEGSHIIYRFSCDKNWEKVKRKMDHLVKQASINSALAVGGLAASFSTGGASLFAKLIALGKGYRDYQDYKEKVTENPGYFLWKVKRKIK